MAGRCGCAGTCGCLLDAGPGISITGSGTSNDPWVVSAIGLADCDAVADCVGQRLGPGLTYDSSTHRLRVYYSLDAGNVAASGSDGGIYSPPVGAPGTAAIVAASTTEITHSGSGTTAKPLKSALSGNRYGNWHVINGSSYVDNGNLFVNAGYVNVPNGTVYIGDAGDDDIHALRVARKIGSTSRYGYFQVTATASDGACIVVAGAGPTTLYTYVFGDDGQITAVAEGTQGTSYRYRPLPWATWTGQTNVKLDPSRPSAVTFPAGRFKDAPMVFANATVSNYWASVHGVSTSGCSVYMRHYNDAISPTTDAPVYLFAVQMTPTNALGRDARRPPPTAAPTLDPNESYAWYALTCETPPAECENSGIPIEMPLSTGTSAAICGVCGRPITNITPTTGG